MLKGEVRNIKKEVLSNNWYTLNKLTFEYQKEDGSWETQQREAYDRGNGAAILLYNQAKKTVVLTRQFRMPTYINGNTDGMMIEVCAGLLDGDHPEDCIRKEVEEETGYIVDKVTKVFESYMSPGSVTEILYFFIGSYEDAIKLSDGGGAEDETENIEVLEYPFDKALAMITSGEIKDAKTIMLLQYAKINKLLGE
ncbi:GDP-mannose pyrophosphatase NudK [Cellulophaga tyrosinoxydans]|uniref:GDP-mannose pyrophosphatase n=1 Tax=Cellulophaga tyrosinoxydans TaxID=504486 RepID=A0A1W2BQF6_9FLAO|nr:GDP-mannose pyrophosphatase NudK [Cellulophaga tyrosinoxydans]SMC75189.1 nudix-type nucleoside diphosphatase, YffH/AdpP family [Cellulophaga tyrosinoxydans]